uniref:Granulins domain-containing protein n=1 Tax=Pygocentrus nattereri TaxID=42514 RepID=A0A3B4DG06_PYGNA
MHLKMLRLTLALALLNLVVGSKCPSQQLCGDQQTCCQVQSSGEYNCCPFHQGECCEDHLHCCPEGMLCQTPQSKCTNSTHSLPWTERISAKKTDLAKSFRMISSSVASKDNIICPDNTSCPAEFSCLKLFDRYSCCPVTQGIICTDGKHCCPNDHECTVDSTSCIKKKAEPVRAVRCADGVSECPVQTSCCATADGGWGCCPMPRAVCCADKVHCCPEDSVCHVNSSKCVTSTKQELPMWAKFPARLRADWEDRKPEAVTPKMTTEQPETSTTSRSTAATTTTMTIAVSKGADVPCNDTVGCADGDTCCKNAQGDWSCCPLPEAVCCDDFVHCCPHGKKCNVAAGTCEDPSGSEPWLEKKPSRPIRGWKLPETKGANVPCNDTAACPDGDTCCKTAQGDWSCCPLPEAVCCDDFVHCCPHGKKCNVAAGTCEDPSGSEPWLEKKPSLPIRGRKLPKTKGADVPCNDTAACPDGDTCCKNAQGDWKCCPLPEAVCCDDFVHCCPHGKKCNVAAGTCEDPSGSEPWLEKKPSLPIRGRKLPKTKGADVPCNDTAACPDGDTCCKNAQGDWKCCPLPEAVCCDDFVHCCPHGKKCNVAAGTCEDPSGSEPWLEKNPSLPIRRRKVPKTKGADVPCNDTAACPDGDTCCKNAQGDWKCCPLPEAVCCDDFVHCCPHGKKCNVAAGTCEDPSGSVPWLEKKPSLPIRGRKPLDKVKGQNTAANVSCDSSHSCPPSSTCCKDVEADWSCCPFTQGVCCKDHLHCCPHDTTCNFRTLACDKGDTSVPMAMVVKAFGRPAQRKENEEVKVEKKPKKNEGNGSIQCDEHHSCPDHTTCCFISKTQKWGCCPLPNAVCCKDGEHCCPEQYKCDTSQTSCIKGDVVIPWYTKVAAESSPDQSAVRCDSQTSCPIGATCCRLGTGKWGCCPLPEATCCPDREHCCPKGYMCDEDSRSCVKTILLQVETVPLTHIRHLHKDIQCGGGFICKDTEACCKTSRSTWGCCPFAKAVCCSDMKHCCPAGYNCGEGGVCTQTTGFNWDHWQVFFSRKKRALLV